MRPFATLTLASTLAVAAWAAVTTGEPPTLMTERGKLLLSDDLSATPAKAWKAAKGTWEVANGAWRGAERPADKHGAVIRQALPFRNAVIQYSFRLDGAKVTTFSINDAKGHLARVLIRPNGFTVQKDDRDHAGPDKVAVLQTVKMPIKAGEWHTLVIEILGREMLARVESGQVGFGTHDAIADPKTNIGFTVAGQSAEFRHLRVWEAQPNPAWPANRANLAARQR